MVPAWFDTGFPAPYIDTGLTVFQRIQSLFLIYAVLAVYTKAVVSRAPPGLQRVLLGTPVFAANIAAPWFFHCLDNLLPRLSSVFVLSWLTNFKVMACNCIVQRSTRVFLPERMDVAASRKARCVVRRIPVDSSFCPKETKLSLFFAFHA